MVLPHTQPLWKALRSTCISSARLEGERSPRLPEIKSLDTWNWVWLISFATPAVAWGQMLQQQTVLLCSYELQLFPFLAASLVVERQLWHHPYIDGTSSDWTKLPWSCYKQGRSNYTRWRSEERQCWAERISHALEWLVYGNISPVGATSKVNL